jgi:hypothetical protein
MQLLLFRYFLLIIIVFYSLSNSKLKQKTNSRIYSKIQENIINASVSGQEMERKNS